MTGRAKIDSWFRHGVETEYIYGLMGTRGGGAGRIVFKNARVPRENMLWKENKGTEVFYKRRRRYMSKKGEVEVEVEKKV